MGSGLMLKPEDLAVLDGELQEMDNRPLMDYNELTVPEKQLDRDLYSVLSQCITGKHRVIIDNVQFQITVDGRFN